MRRYVLGDTQSEEMRLNWYEVFVYIFYIHNVVGEVVYCTNDIYGGAT